MLPKREENEIISAPQITGTYPPTVDPINMPMRTIALRLTFLDPAQRKHPLEFLSLEAKK